MISRGESGKFAKAKFYSAFNDVDVFVEDTAAESRKVYVEILSRVLGDSILISQVFPIGSKPTVIKRCKADQGSRDRRAIYIVDGDYQCISGGSNRLLRFYQLKRYCIENYLIDGLAIADVANDESTSEDRFTILQKLDFDEWIKRLSSALAQVVLAQIAASLKPCNMPTVKIELARIQGEHRDHVDLGKSVSFVLGYQEALDEKWGEGAFESEVLALRAVLNLDDVSIVIRHMSAKAVLMPLLRSRLARRLCLDIEYPKFRVRLASRCNVDELSDLSLRVR